MSTEEEIRFLPYEEALHIVAAIQEEEDVRVPNHKVLTVYNKEDREICWFDFEEIMKAVGPVSKEEEKDAVSDYILRHLPDWVQEI
jgi:stringent starvation protein B